MSLSDYREPMNHLIDAVTAWEESFPAFEADESLAIDETRFKEVSREFTERLKDNYPFHHPLYAGQMLKPPHPAAMIGYLAAMMINPNNHALDAGPATAAMEKELIGIFARKFGFNTHLGHLTSSGTIANFEALLIAREIHPEMAVVLSDQAHYTHKRVCHWLKMECLEARSDRYGRMDSDHVKEILASRNVGTVVATLGTTSLGASDSLDELLQLQKEYGFRIHVDSAYGGYFMVISPYAESLAVYNLINRCDSVVFDPHKQGLQPYGCGCVIFSDPGVGKYYSHSSPYTYFTSSELHLGEISIECSRAGAAAAALWLTTKLFELEYDRGMGPLLKKTIDAARGMASLVKASPAFCLYVEPESNIVTYFPKAESTEAISRLSTEIMTTGMTQGDKQLYVATLKVKGSHFALNHPEITINTDEVTILRSCLMKPEHKIWVPEIMAILENLYQAATTRRRPAHA